MERADSTLGDDPTGEPRPGAGLPRVLVAEPLVTLPAADLALDEAAAHHLRVRRSREGERIGLADGAGGLAEGVLTALDKRFARVAVERMATIGPLSPVHLLAPIGDRDRMLWLMEKCTELGLTSWRSVRWHRSRSVTPRGEGSAFHEKLRARAVSALLQSGGAWLPRILDDAAPDAAFAGAEGDRLVLEAGGRPIAHRPATFPVTLALGPEGGLEAAELQAARDARFAAVSLGASILRFETAGMVAVGIVRALQPG